MDTSAPVSTMESSTNAATQGYDGITALAAIVRGGAALTALSTDVGATAGVDLRSICTNVHGFQVDELPDSLFACFYEHLLLQHEPLDLSTSDVERRYLDWLGALFLTLACPDVLEIFILVVGLAFMWRRSTSAEHSNWLDSNQYSSCLL